MRVVLWTCAWSLVPDVVLRPAGVRMPAVGLGTGGYGASPAVGEGGYPECWAEHPTQLDGAGACGPWVEDAVATWLKVGGRRIDSADSYSNQRSVGRGLQRGTVPRDELFLLSKVGSTNPMGYNETLWAAAGVLADLQTTHVDLLLVHWPTSAPTKLNDTVSTDPACRTDARGFSADPGECRLSTWRAFVRLLHEGKARAIGVSNYNQSHIEEIARAGLPLPSVNQVPFNPSLGVAQAPLKAYLEARGIQMMGYSPLGIPDLPHWRPTHGTLLEDSSVRRVAAAHGKTPAQIVLRWAWQQGVATHPRSVREAHMRENLDIFDFALRPAEMALITALPQDYCAGEPLPTFYECFPQWLHYPPQNTVHLEAAAAAELLV